MKLFVILSALLLLTWSQSSEAVCGYKGCPTPKSSLINVHLVPHSHDDTGWLKTVDQYYYGSRNNIQHAGVQYILDSVVEELMKDSKRRFIQVETSFFMKWYNQQTAAKQKDVKKLVDEGRLEFTGGAWSMNDEAAVHYQSVIDQFSVGLKALSTTFGSCARPRIGWQIDPFGHSREMASIFAQMGFDGEFFARMDYVEKNERLNNLTGEVIWKASESLGERSEIFTGELYNHYSAPPGFCFDNLCSDSPIIDGDSYDNNVKEKVDDFLTYINKMAKYYRASHLLVPMGDDFNYENAAMNFKNMDKLIKYVNERQLQGSKVNVFYSTPACYLKALHELKLTWPIKTQDFFPYSTDWHTYWTGYFTSRPTQKRFERDGNHFLQVSKQLTALGNLTTAAANQNLDKLRHAMGIMQHHDAITGTEKQHVAYDYDRMLTDAIMAASNNTRDALRKMTNLTNGNFGICLQLNVSSCEFTQYDANNLVVTVFNPLNHDSTQYVRIPVVNGNYRVTDAQGQLVRSELVPVAKDFLAKNTLRLNITQHELVFEAYADKLANYYVKRDPQPKEYYEYKVEDVNDEPTVPKRFHKLAQLRDAVKENEAESKAGEIVVLQNSLIKLTFGVDGLLSKVEMNGVSQDVKQQFYYYKGAYGNNGEFKNRSSGAYIFRPNGSEILIASKADITVHVGNMVKEVHQRFNNWTSQVVRLYDNVNRVEFEWLIGPIPIEDNIGKEVITRFRTNISSGGVFYTDSNGREMLKRTRNAREYFKPNMTESVSGNYYPITSRLSLQNTIRRMTLLNDRAQGGSSLKDGELELMLHRRLLRDDAFGVGEALNETVMGQGLVARGKVYLIVSPVSATYTAAERRAQQEIHLPFWKFFSNATQATSKVPPRLPTLSSLPQNIRILTLEPHATNERLLRLEYILDTTESSAITFNIRELFDALGGTEIRETTLDGNMALSSMSRFKFQPDGKVPSSKLEYYTSKHTPLSAVAKDARTKFNISMDPMQIRTFILKWK